MVMAIKSFNQRSPTLIDSGLDTPAPVSTRMNAVHRQRVRADKNDEIEWMVTFCTAVDGIKELDSHPLINDVCLSVSFCDTWYDVNERMWEWSLGIYAILQLHCVTSLLLRRGSIITWGMHLASELVNCDIVSRFSPRLSLPWSAEYQTAMESWGILQIMRVRQTRWINFDLLAQHCC